ncbi:MAG: hypothetical protein LBU88_10970 [Treponema sp.]|nr:hypothetical protein [Treponema sp.]
MFIYLKWYIQNRTSASGVIKETRVEVKRWINEINLSIADINSVTDRNLQLIEDKIIKLNEIIEDTDKRISVYVKEVEKSRTSEALYTQLGRGVRAAIHNTPAPETPKPPPAPPVQPPPPVQRMLPLEDTVPVKPQKTKKEIRTHIDQLAEEGLSSPQIAAQLGISIAEVDIAMQIRRRG